jgi:acetaldehyde dehydrogenase (acetylating)
VQIEDKDLRSIQEVRKLITAAEEAQRIYAGFSQSQVDRVTAAAARAGAEASERLAALAVEESGFGRKESKILKNRFSSQTLWEHIQGLKTVGVIHRDDHKGVMEIAEPYGVILGIIPITNPTSTALFKGIISLKTRNAIVFSPHPRGIRCISESAKVMADAAEGAGAPAGLISCISQVSMEGINEAMKHPKTSLILATGGSAMVKAAYSAGKPAYGVGPGNAPAFIERTANIRAAVKAVIVSQTFDNGTICSSEQSVVIDAPVRDRVLREFAAQGAHLCSEQEKALIEKIISKKGGINPDIVGRYPHELARMAGFEVPRETTVILAEETCVGENHPLSMEKLSPILGVFIADGWERCCELCIELIKFGGMGHTMAIHSMNEEIIMRFALEKPVSRILVNAPTSQGAVGYATNLTPSMTLGCGAHGGNITSDNVSARNLMLIKRLARVKPGFVEGVEVKRTFRPGHMELASETAPPEPGYVYKNTAYNAPKKSTPAFSMKEAEGKKSVPDERCPLGGCESCS